MNHLDRVHLQRSLIQLASLLVLILLISGLLALFSLWSLNRAYQADQNRVNELARLLDSGRAAQGHFRSEVQEWKDALLRGADPDQRARYLSSVDAEHSAAQELLLRLRALTNSRAISDLSAQLDAILSAEGSLYLAYRQALDTADPKHWDASLLDRQVAGLDRPLQGQFDGLMKRLTQEIESTVTEAHQRESERYASLQQVLWVAMALSIAVVASLLWRVIGRGSNR